MSSQKDPLYRLFSDVHLQPRMTDNDAEFIRVVRQRVRRSLAKRISFVIACACVLAVSWHHYAASVTHSISAEKVVTIDSSGADHTMPRVDALNTHIDWAEDIDYAWADLEDLLYLDDEAFESSGPQVHGAATSRMAVAAYFIDIIETKETH